MIGKIKIIGNISNNYVYNLYLLISMKREFLIFLFQLLLISVLGNFKEVNIPFSAFKEHMGWIHPEQLTFDFKYNASYLDIKSKVEGDYTIRKTFELELHAIPEQRWESELELKCQSSKKMPIFYQRLEYNKGQTDIPFAFQVQRDQKYRFVIKDCYNVYKKQYDNDKLFLHIRVTENKKDEAVAEEVSEKKQEEL